MKKRTIETHQSSRLIGENKIKTINYIENQLIFHLETIDIIRNKYGPNYNLGGAAHTIFFDIGYLVYFKKDNETYNILFYYSQLNYANFLIRTNVGNTVHFMVANKEIETTGVFKNSEIGSSNVVSGICAAQILRDKEKLSFYADIPVTFTEQANQEDIIGELMMHFYQLLIKEEVTKDTAATVYQQITKLLDWEEYKQYIKVEGFNSLAIWEDVFDARKPMVEAQTLPVLLIYYYILTQDQAGYEEAVYEALLKWKTYFTLPKYTVNGQEIDHSTQSWGYLSLPIASACAYAYDRGMKLKTVESDYIPKWMIEGEFDGFELLVKGDGSTLGSLVPPLCEV